MLKNFITSCPRSQLTSEILTPPTFLFFRTKCKIFAMQCLLYCENKLLPTSRMVVNLLDVCRRKGVTQWVLILFYFMCIDTAFLVFKLLWLLLESSVKNLSLELWKESCFRTKSSYWFSSKRPFFLISKFKLEVFKF